MPIRGKTLVVDDSPANLRLLFSTLELILAEDVEQGLALARRELPDLIVSALHLRKQSGHDFIRAVRADALLPIDPQTLLTVIEACLRPAKGD